MISAVEKAVSWYRKQLERSGRPHPELGLLLRKRGYYLLDGPRVRHDPLGHIWSHAARKANEWGYGGPPSSKADRLKAARFFARHAGVSWWRVWRFGILWDSDAITADDLYAPEELISEKSRWIGSVVER